MYGIALSLPTRYTPDATLYSTLHATLYSTLDALNTLSG
jgi:hypothetical protein